MLLNLDVELVEPNYQFNTVLSYKSNHKLKSGNDFTNVFMLSKKQISKHLKLYHCKNNLMHSRLGLIVSRKINKLANKRNYMRRVIKELFRQNQINWASNDVIVNVSKKFINKDFQQIQKEFKELTIPLLK